MSPFPPNQLAGPSVIIVPANASPIFPATGNYHPEEGYPHYIPFKFLPMEQPMAAREGTRPTDIAMERPSRSDAHLSVVEEARKAEEARAYFDGAAPKRHTKPMRSEYAAQYQDSLQSSDEIPELAKFQDLESHSQKLVCDGSKVVEEFVETEYYKDLTGVGKQHHTTGTGFIKTESMKGNGFHLAPDLVMAEEHHASCRGNPATNEWIPSTETVMSASSKPNRSDS